MRILLVPVALALVACASPRPGDVPPGEWRPGVFRGLVVGRATGEEVRRVLGPPRDSGTVRTEPGDPRPPAWYDYGHDESLLPARLTVYLRRDTLALVELVPDDPSRAEVLRRLGPRHVTTFYRECPGWEASEAPPVYRDASARTGAGAMESVEYPARGIALSGNEQEVLAVVIGPAGLPGREACPAPPAEDDGS